LFAQNADELLQPAETALATAKGTGQSAAAGALKTSGSINKQDIITALRGNGYTPDLVAEAIEKGKINAYILDDASFTRQFVLHGGKIAPGSEVNAFASAENIFLRQSKAATRELYGQAVHEGRHA